MPPFRLAGAQLLGCGGGGSAHNGRLRLLAELAAGRQARVLPLQLLGPEDLVVDCGGMGAPTVSMEKLEANEVGWRLPAFDRAVAALQKAATSTVQVELATWIQ